MSFYLPFFTCPHRTNHHFNMPRVCYAVLPIKNFLFFIGIKYQISPLTFKFICSNRFFFLLVVINTISSVNHIWFWLRHTPCLIPRGVLLLNNRSFCPCSKLVLHRSARKEKKRKLIPAYSSEITSLVLFLSLFILFLLLHSSRLLKYLFLLSMR